jgi:flagellar protein FliO/FliZ
MLLALCIVLGLMWGLSRFAKRRGRAGGGSRPGQVVTVVARQALSRNTTVAVVQVMDRAMILGVTDGQVTLLGDTDLAAVQERLAPTPRAITVRRPRLGSAPAADKEFPGDLADPADPSTDTRPTELTDQDVVAAVTPRSALSGSALSPDTWKQAVEALRERTVRR